MMVIPPTIGVILILVGIILFIVDLSVTNHGLLTAGGIVTLLAGGLALLEAGVPYSGLLPEDYYEVGQRARGVRLALEASPAALVPCHNDPWPGNLLDADGRIYLIDWEYSGMNDPMWDLADLSVEGGFKLEQDRAIMEVYYGRGLSPALYSRLEVYKAMSDLHWSVWGFVQRAKGNPAEDFWSYGLERLGRSKARMSGADFGQHLSVVRTGGLQHHSSYSDTPALYSPNCAEI